jgi:BirA family biotin operon repressor/biotin-[acetyl-CoA-carboxylase] ligase
VAPDVLLRALADGRVHSGEELARDLRVTRAAVWKSVPKLAQWGLEVEAVPGVGYRLMRPLDLLDAAALRASLAPATAERVTRLDVFTEVDSTNRYLLSLPAPRFGELAVCIAEFQHAGRGRRGRRWIAPQFADAPADLSALTLAVGVVVRRAVAAVAGVDVALKWPNDLVLEGRKLGGILLELEGEAQGGCHVVAGIGVNVALPPESLRTLSDWPQGAIDLATATCGTPPARAALAVGLIDRLAELFAGYAVSGFAPYRADWRAADFLKGRRVTLHDVAGERSGTALGIEADGALVVESANGVRQRVISGDVSVRSA